jgi:hypothetical protein
MELSNKHNKKLPAGIIATAALIAIGSLTVYGANDEPQETCITQTAEQSETASELVDRSASQIPGNSTDIDVYEATGGDYPKTVVAGKKYQVCGTPDGSLRLEEIK